MAPRRRPGRRVRRQAVARPLPAGPRRAAVLVPAPAAQRQDGQARGGPRRAPARRSRRHPALSALGRRHRGRRVRALPRLPSRDPRRGVPRGRVRDGRDVAPRPAPFRLAERFHRLRLPVPRAPHRGGTPWRRLAARGAPHGFERHDGEHRRRVHRGRAETNRPVLPAPGASRPARGSAGPRERRLPRDDEHRGRRDGAARAVGRNPARADRRQLPPLPDPRPGDARRRG